MTPLQFLELNVIGPGGRVLSEGHFSDRFSPAEEPAVVRLLPGEKFAAAVAPLATVPHAKRVADIMTQEVCSVGELATLGEIADLLETKHVKRVPVVHDGKIVGIVSRADLLKVLVSGGAETAHEEQP